MPISKTRKKELHKAFGAAPDMTKKEVQYLIETYQMWQPLAMSTKSHLSGLAKESLKAPVFKHVTADVHRLRTDILACLDLWVEKHPAAKYFKDYISGIGPLSAAGLAAYIDISKCRNHYSSIWALAGLAPGSIPCTGAKANRLINAALDAHGETKAPTKKHLEFLIKKGKLPRHCFLLSVKSQYTGKPTWGMVYYALKKIRYSPGFHAICISIGNSIILKPSIYRDLFRYRSQYMFAKSERGEYASVAKEQLMNFKFNSKKVAYKAYIQGKLPNKHIRNSARRWAVKVLLAHYYEIEYYVRYDKPPPQVYALDILQGDVKIHLPGPWKEFRETLAEAESGRYVR